MVRLKCKSCDKEYLGKTNASMYCSDTCKKREYRKRKKKTFKKICKECSKEFSTTKDNKIYCSTKCRKRKDSREYRSNNKKPSKTYNKTCPTCNTQFEAKRSDHVYCKPTCQPSSKQAKSLRKRTKRKAKLSVESWKDIQSYINTRPSDEYELDHIVPLNHPDVCGLHNTWNFQWLTKEENNRKSNKFKKDGSI